MTACSLLDTNGGTVSTSRALHGKHLARQRHQDCYELVVLFASAVFSRPFFPSHMLHARPRVLSSGPCLKPATVQHCTSQTPSHQKGQCTSLVPVWYEVCHWYRAIASTPAVQASARGSDSRRTLMSTTKVGNKKLRNDRALRFGFRVQLLT
jgi:hypothetical protein